MTQPDVDRDTIEKLSRLETGIPDLRIPSWKTTTLSVQGRRSIFRFSGSGIAGGMSHPWSVVLKQIQSPENPNAPDAEIDHCAYWEREYLLYEAGVPQALTGDMRAPTCYGTQQPSPDLRWIWLEDLNDRYNWNWLIEQFTLTAYSLGVFNGMYLMDKPVPGEEYISRNHLRCASAHYIDEFNRYRDPSIWEQPLIRKAYPKPVIETLDQLTKDREKLLEVLEGLEQTFCHQDAWHGNMAAVVNPDHSASTVLFDWALSGTGAPGEEIANLIWTAFLEFKVDVQNAAVLETLVLTKYIQGLEDSGWKPDPTWVRIAYLIKSVLLFGYQLEAVDLAMEEDTYAETERFYGLPIERLVNQDAQVTYLLIERIDELFALLDRQFS